MNLLQSPRSAGWFYGTTHLYSHLKNPKQNKRRVQQKTERIGAKVSTCLSLIFSAVMN